MYMYMCIITVFRYNLDPFHKYTDEVIWETLGQVHMKEKVYVLKYVKCKDLLDDYGKPKWTKIVKTYF